MLDQATTSRDIERCARAILEHPGAVNTDLQDARVCLASIRTPGSRDWREQRDTALAGAGDRARGRLLLKFGDQAYAAKDCELALSQYEEAAPLLESTRATADDIWAACSQAGDCAVGIRRFMAAARWFERALATARAWRLWPAEAVAADSLVTVLQQVDPARLTAISHAWPTFPDDDRDDPRIVLYNGAIAHRRLGDPQRALLMLTELERRLGPPGPSEPRARLLDQRAGATLEVGDAPAAIALHEAALNVAARVPTRRPRLMVELLGDRALTMLRAGADGTDAALARALDVALQAREQPYAIFLALRLAGLRLSMEPPQRKTALDALVAARGCVARAGADAQVTAEYVSVLRAALSESTADYLEFLRALRDDASEQEGPSKPGWTLRLGVPPVQTTLLGLLSVVGTSLFCAA
jgi:tetratricopeptide (TPR) repeat protein